MSQPAPREITRWLLEWHHGDASSFEKLLPVVYEELRILAAAAFRRQRAQATLQSTALVHEAYLRLVDQRHVPWQNRAHFFGIAARLMRQIMVDHARARNAKKRGGGLKLTVHEELAGGQEPRYVDLIALDDALRRLAEFDERQSRLVEMRYFAGLTVEETSEALGISQATVKREWKLARAWLFGQLAH